MSKKLMYRSFLVAGLILVHVAAANAQNAEPPEPVAKKKPAAPTATRVTSPPSGVAEANKGRGRLFVKESGWDFGHVVQDAQVSHAFALENVGDDTLFIERIKPT